MISCGRHAPPASSSSSLRGGAMRCWVGGAEVLCACLIGVTLRLLPPSPDSLEDSRHLTAYLRLLLPPPRRLLFRPHILFLRTTRRSSLRAAASPDHDRQRASRHNVHTPALVMRTSLPLSRSSASPWITSPALARQHNHEVV